MSISNKKYKKNMYRNYEIPVVKLFFRKENNFERLATIRTIFLIFDFFGFILLMLTKYTSKVKQFQ